MEPEVSLQFSQQPTICPLPETGYHFTPPYYSLKIRFNAMYVLRLGLSRAFLL
jgi:hypothetical protein